MCTLKKTQPLEVTFVRIPLIADALCTNGIEYVVTDNRYVALLTLTGFNKNALSDRQTRYNLLTNMAIYTEKQRQRKCFSDDASA